MKLTNRVAVVTGGGKGLGRAICRQLAKDGALVSVLDIDEDSGTETANELKETGAEAQFVPVDVASESSIQKAINVTVERLGKIDILVNNVGIISRKSLSDCSLDEWRRIFQVNVESVFLTSKHVVPIMRRGGGGAIVNMSSIAGLVAAANRPAYCASKGAINALTRQLSLDCAPFNIRVNAVAPSSVENTGMYQDRPDVKENSEAVKAALFATHPLFKGLGRICKAEEVASVVAFLASSEASMLTGLIVPVEGGALASLV